MPEQVFAAAPLPPLPTATPEPARCEASSSDQTRPRTAGTLPSDSLCPTSLSREPSRIRARGGPKSPGPKPSDSGWSTVLRASDQPIPSTKPGSAQERPGQPGAVALLGSRLGARPWVYRAPFRVDRRSQRPRERNWASRPRFPATLPRPEHRPTVTRGRVDRPSGRRARAAGPPTLTASRSTWRRPTAVRSRPDDDLGRSETIGRFGWWGGGVNGSPLKVGEYQGLGTSPFWDIDTDSQRRPGYASTSGAPSSTAKRGTSSSQFYRERVQGERRFRAVPPPAGEHAALRRLAARAPIRWSPTI